MKLLLVVSVATIHYVQLLTLNNFIINMLAMHDRTVT